MNGAFRDFYKFLFEKTPIFLTGGEYDSPMPIIGLVGQLAALGQGILTNGFTLNDFYADFLPLPGNSVINNAIATYPFANQQVAANAIIEQPLPLPMLMISPVRDEGGYLTKLAIFTALRTALQNHNNAGGTYTVLTPAYPYFGCVLLDMSDVTDGSSNQRQAKWQLDFVKPLISISDANAAFSNQMNKISNGSYLPSSQPSGI